MNEGKSLPPRNRRRKDYSLFNQAGNKPRPNSAIPGFERFTNNSCSSTPLPRMMVFERTSRRPPSLVEPNRGPPRDGPQLGNRSSQRPENNLGCSRGHGDQFTSAKPPVYQRPETENQHPRRYLRSLSLDSTTPETSHSEGEIQRNLRQSGPSLS